MADNKYEQVMEILKNESDMELKCAKKTYELMKRTINPFKRIALKKSIKMFMNHSVGIDIAIHAIEREIGES